MRENERGCYVCVCMFCVCLPSQCVCVYLNFLKFCNVRVKIKRNLKGVKKHDNKDDNIHNLNNGK